jgi:predicted ATPase
MIISRLHLKNWRNFKRVDVALRDRVYVIGPNASGKSNLLDVLRFLRDVAKPDGGGLQKAVKERGGIKRLRCLNARKDPNIHIEVELSEKADAPPLWRYTLVLKSEGTGQQRPVVAKEEVVDLRRSKKLVDRPDEQDRKDKERLTETHLEQVNSNKDFRAVAEFFSTVTYLHLVPQLLKYGEKIGGSLLEDDPFGQAFLQSIAKATPRVQTSRLKKIEKALKVCVPNMRELAFERDPITGAPHLKALYEHWRPDAGWQSESEFSDGTLRLLGIMWSLLDGDGLLLLEEPELSLNESIVERIHKLIVDMQRSAKHSRQVFITTHSEALLRERALDPREVIRLEPTADGTVVHEADEADIQAIKSGYTIAEAMLPKVKPGNLDQLSLWER